MAVRQVLGVVGAVIGFWVGGPQGAQIGFAIGNAIGGVVDPLIIRGPKLGDVGQQTAQEGGPRPIVFGLSQPMAGNIIASGQVHRIKRRKRQGKGGPKVEEEHLLRTYAIGICEGPVTKLVRVWRNGELIYNGQELDELNFDGTDTPESFAEAIHLITSNNFKVGQKATFYAGTFDQEADPGLQEEFGVDGTPPYRGTAYIVIRNDDLTDQRGAIPQYTFQVERCEGTFLTSRPYPLEDVAAMSDDLLARGGFQMTPDLGLMDAGLTGTGGELFGGLIEYEDGEPEAMDAALEARDGEFFGELVEYEDGEPEAMDAESLEATGGDFFGDVVGYDDGEPEAMDIVGLEPLDGTLEEP
jgi:hypothetical protein